MERRWFDAVDLPLVASGQASTVVSLPGGGRARLQVFEHPVDINQMFYDLRLLHGVDYVLTSGAVRGRFEADTARFAAQQRFYRFLDRSAEHAASFRPGRGVSGPTIDIYRIEDRARAAIVGTGGLHALWWAEYVPQAYRSAYEEMAVEPEGRSRGALVTPDGQIAPWIGSLGGFFDADVQPFLRLLSVELSTLGRVGAAAPLVEAIHLMHPRDVVACLAFVRCAEALESWHEAEAAATRTLALADGRDPALPDLRFARALALSSLMRRSEARGELEWVIAHAPEESELRAAAEAEARKLRAAGR
jgi:hypothetical protein